MKEALYYKQLNEGLVQCQLCPHFCTIFPGERGKCGVRENKSGKLFSLVYNRLAAKGIDPIEKKPFFHFHPGEPAFSIATAGCNFFCQFCQNCGLSQETKPDRPIFGEIVSPEHVIQLAKESNCRIISYTYAEPTIAFEYYLEIMELAKKEGMLNTFVTNGFINPEPLKQLAPLMDAANIDLKGFSEDFYEKVVGGRLKPVLDSIRLYKKLGIWVELTTLIVPGENDSIDELKKLSKFIADLDKDTPWHITRFYPMFKMSHLPPTPVETLQKAALLGKETGLRYVYTGNVQGGQEDTICPKCGAVAIKRNGFLIRSQLENGKCKSCGTTIPGVF